MSKSVAPKLGKIKLSEGDKAVIAEGVEDEFFKILKNKIRPQRQTQIALLNINSMPTVEIANHYRGATSEWDQMIRVLENIAKEYNGQIVDEEEEADKTAT